MSQGGFLSGLIPQKLPVSENKFTDIVEKFDFEDIIEQIKEIDLHLSKLKSLKANRNQIVRFTDTIFKLQLQELDLANNLVNEIPEIDDDNSQLKIYLG